MLGRTAHHDVSQSSQLLSVLIGLAFGTTIYATLFAIILYFGNVDMDAFGMRMLVAVLASVLAFSSHKLLNDLQDDGLAPLLFNLGLRWLFVFMVVLLSAYIEKSAERLSRAVMLSWLVLTPFSLLCTAILIRFLAGLYFANPKRRRKAVLVWTNAACADLVEALRRSPLAAIELIGFFDNRHEARPPAGLPRLGSLADAAEWIRDPVSEKMRADVVFVGLNTKEPEELSEIINVLQDSTISTYFVPESLIFGMPGIQLRELAGRPVLASTETPFIGLAGLPKRLIDALGAGLGLLLLSPLLLLVALGIKLTSPGPVFFVQKRYGSAGKPINVYKFRSMRVELDDGPVIQATQDDPRVTPFGAFLRRTSLDELPQLLNVLRGDMSLVGPRPHAVEHNELYRKLVTGYMFRHKIKPGITGWAQVNGLRGETDTLEKMQKRVDYDLYYIQNWSLWLDLVILWRTVRVLFGDKNAY